MQSKNYNIKGKKITLNHPTISRVNHRVIKKDQDYYIIGGSDYDSKIISQILKINGKTYIPQKISIKNKISMEGLTTFIYKGSIFIYGWNMFTQQRNSLFRLDQNNIQKNSYVFNLIQASGQIPSSRSFFSSSFIQNRYLIIFGGNDYKQCFKSFFILDCQTMKWKRLNNRDCQLPKGGISKMTWFQNIGILFIGQQYQKNNKALAYKNKFFKLTFENQEQKNNSLLPINGQLKIKQIIFPNNNNNNSFLSFPSNLTKSKSSLSSSSLNYLSFNFNSFNNSYSQPEPRGDPYIKLITKRCLLFFGGQRFGTSKKSQNNLLYDTWILDLKSLQWQKLDYMISSSCQFDAIFQFDKSFKDLIHDYNEKSTNMNINLKSQEKQSKKDSKKNNKNYKQIQKEKQKQRLLTQPSFKKFQSNKNQIDKPSCKFKKQELKSQNIDELDYQQIISVDSQQLEKGMKGLKIDFSRICKEFQKQIIPAATSNLLIQNQNQIRVKQQVICPLLSSSSSSSKISEYGCLIIFGGISAPRILSSDIQIIDLSELYSNQYVKSQQLCKNCYILEQQKKQKRQKQKQIQRQKQRQKQAQKINTLNININNLYNLNYFNNKNKMDIQNFEDLFKMKAQNQNQMIDQNQVSFKNQIQMKVQNQGQNNFNFNSNSSTKNNSSSNSYIFPTQFKSNFLSNSQPQLQEQLQSQIQLKPQIQTNVEFKNQNQLQSKFKFKQLGIFQEQHNRHFHYQKEKQIEFITHLSSYKQQYTHYDKNNTLYNNNNNLSQYKFYVQPRQSVNNIPGYFIYQMGNQIQYSVNAIALLIDNSFNVSANSIQISLKQIEGNFQNNGQLYKDQTSNFNKERVQQTHHTFNFLNKNKNKCITPSFPLDFDITYKNIDNKYKNQSKNNLKIQNSLPIQKIKTQYLIYQDNSSPFTLQQAEQIIYKLDWKRGITSSDIKIDQQDAIWKQYGVNLKLASMKLGQSFLFITKTFNTNQVFVSFVSKDSICQHPYLKTNHHTHNHNYYDNNHNHYDCHQKKNIKLEEKSDKYKNKYSLYENQNQKYYPTYCLHYVLQVQIMKQKEKELEKQQQQQEIRNKMIIKCVRGKEIRDIIMKKIQQLLSIKNYKNQKKIQNKKCLLETFQDIAMFSTKLYVFNLAQETIQLISKDYSQNKYRKQSNKEGSQQVDIINSSKQIQNENQKSLSLCQGSLGFHNGNGLIKYKATIPILNSNLNNHPDFSTSDYQFFIKYQYLKPYIGRSIKVQNKKIDFGNHMLKFSKDEAAGLITSIDLKNQQQYFNQISLYYRFPSDLSNINHFLKDGHHWNENGNLVHSPTLNNNNGSHNFNMMSPYFYSENSRSNHLIFNHEKNQNLYIGQNSSTQQMYDLPYVFIYHQNRLIQIKQFFNPILCGYIQIPQQIQINIFKDKILKTRDCKKLDAFLKRKHQECKKIYHDKLIVSLGVSNSGIQKKNENFTSQKGSNHSIHGGDLQNLHFIDQSNLNISLQQNFLKQDAFDTNFKQDECIRKMTKLNDYL